METFCGAHTEGLVQQQQQFSSFLCHSPLFIHSSEHCAHMHAHTLSILCLNIHLLHLPKRPSIAAGRLPHPHRHPNESLGIGGIEEMHEGGQIRAAVLWEVAQRAVTDYKSLLQCGHLVLVTHSNAFDSVQRNRFAGRLSIPHGTSALWR